MLPGPWNLVFGNPQRHSFLVGDAKYPIPKKLYLMPLELAWQGFIIWNLFLLCLAWFCVTFLHFTSFAKRTLFSLFYMFYCPKLNLDQAPFS
jgi:hypothetical protein